MATSEAPDCFQSESPCMVYIK